tara:strand:+ start:35 stop:277 length:243 start_codon:yes stop_codon:yes gene_type:complete
MSATPRTDDQDLITLISDIDGAPFEVVHAEFARQLEGELVNMTSVVNKVVETLEDDGFYGSYALGDDLYKELVALVKEPK